jgi:hypothetical protein
MKRQMGVAYDNNPMLILAIDHLVSSIELEDHHNIFQNNVDYDATTKDGTISLSNQHRIDRFAENSDVAINLQSRVSYRLIYSPPPQLNSGSPSVNTVPDT